MREIKFRAWDKSISSFTKDFAITYDGWVFQSFVGKRRTDLIIMQWTGLQDKNGVDIYEGDFVCGEDNRKKTGPFVVQWWEYESGFTPFISRLCDDYFGGLDQDTIEVVGNIHENPELLLDKAGE